MSLTTNIRNRLLDAINVAFAAIGTDVHTKMPKLKKGDNKSPVAWEYFVSSHLVTLANARFDVAKRAAISVGVIFDHEKFPREPGTNEPIFHGEHVAVWLTVRNASTRVNPDVMVEYLSSHGVSQSLLDEAYQAASKPTKPPHIFKASLVASDPVSK